MTYTPKTWVNGQLVDAADTNRIEQGISANDTVLADKANTGDIPTVITDLTGLLALAQLVIDGVKMVVFNTATQTWQSNPSGGRMDIHIMFVGGDVAHPPPSIPGRDLWFRPVP